MNDLVLVTTISEREFARTNLYRLKLDDGYILAAAEMCGIEEIARMTNDIDVSKQAKTIVMLRHDSIVRLIGVCEAGFQTILVTEYALLGPMNEFLRQHPTIPTENIVQLMCQVAQGMAYLEKNRIVHCCLAAKHILLASEKQVKISNFSFIEQLDFTVNCCIKDLKHDKGLQKWLAPESFKTNEFSSKSDVWSFRITLWESMSYGKEPYGDEDVWEVQRMRPNSFSMEKPENCPDPIYYMMLECWSKLPEYRPTFPMIIRTFKNIFKGMNIQQVSVNVQTDQNRLYNIDSSQLTSVSRIGRGSFGENYLGHCEIKNVVYPAIVKTGDKENVSKALVSFTHEVQMMSKLRHSYVAASLGICLGIESVALVVHASEFGSLQYFHAQSR